MNTSFFRNMIEQKLLALHTAYLATVLSVNGNYATVQPLSLIKATGEDAKKQAVLENVPICKHTLEYITQGTVVLCVCCERDISQTRFGKFSLPSLRRHSLSDSIIIGCL